MLVIYSRRQIGIKKTEKFFSPGNLFRVIGIGLIKPLSDSDGGENERNKGLGFPQTLGGFGLYNSHPTG
jgi:hypothetical protein